jgi:hypothetical protein
MTDVLKSEHPYWRERNPERRAEARRQFELPLWRVISEPSIDGVVKVALDDDRFGFRHVAGGPVYEFRGSKAKHAAYHNAAGRKPNRRKKQ